MSSGVSFIAGGPHRNQVSRAVDSQHLGGPNSWILEKPLDALLFWTATTDNSFTLA